MRCPSLPTSYISSAAALALIIGSLPNPASATVEPLFPEPTPLVLKDGRIANVSVHRIPFATGADELDEAASAELQALLAPLATDCFLTAQAIGHVAPGRGGDGDTLSAHRLARARADHIQGELAGLGMPQPAVASVWDWQFLVEKSQVTLWVFSLNVGDDCDGTRLPAPSAVSAEAPAENGEELVGDAPPPPRELVVSGQTSADAVAAASDDPAIVTELAPPAEAPAAAAVSAADQAAERSAAAAALAAGAAAAADQVIDDPLATAAVTPAPDSPAPETPARAATPDESALSSATSAAEPARETASTATVAALDQASQPPATASGGAADLVITFDVNSSFFPGGATQALRQFVATLPADAPVTIELSGAVGTGDVRGASAEEAKRYNAWMAERRIERVAEWLQGNASGRRLTVTESLVENDSSRQVRLKADIVE